MNSQSTLSITLEPQDNQRLANLCGQLDEHLRQIEKNLGVEINNRGALFNVIGAQSAATVAKQVISDLYQMTADETLSASNVHLHLQSPQILAMMEGGSATDKTAEVQTRRGIIRARGANQAAFLEQIKKHDLVFGIGPAGTGKTYLAVACAVAALESDNVRRLVLVRPAVEAGERLGFLPGDLAQKIDPYLRPMMDALYEMLGFDRVQKLMERNVIEVAPLAYMRGRTLNESFIILDEAQNTSREQMKMFLTRIGFASTAIVNGDTTQTDLPSEGHSGLVHASKILKNVKGVAFTHFDAEDVVRHPLVKKIVKAYHRAEQ